MGTGLRLHGEGHTNPYHENLDQPVYVLRYTDGENYDIPFSSNFGGSNTDGQPCTGTGYLGSDKHLIPEYKVFRQDDKGALITDGVIFRINADGTENPVAYYVQDKRGFELWHKEE